MITNLFTPHFAALICSLFFSMTIHTMCNQVYAQDKYSLSKFRYNVKLEQKTPISKIIISDKMGNIILEKQDETLEGNRIEIDMSPYKSDNYYVILQYEDGKIEPQQIAKF